MKSTIVVLFLLPIKLNGISSLVLQVVTKVHYRRSQTITFRATAGTGLFAASIDDIVKKWS
ncbi:hypothetical protein C7R92_00515 [Brevibacillus porteri]|uniref:Uncharacterized protein n=1 Tax=Brevibacillus porteri TaxID=2126350 RepID=A0ABX5FX71_9BACL|nr:hypothetical protein C7R92_00515 [Brevibacillus porteri]